MLVTSGSLVVAAMLVGAVDDVVSAGGSSCSLQDLFSRGPAGASVAVLETARR